MTEKLFMVSTGALLVNPRGEILLQQRDDRPELLFPGCWTMFGGAMEAGETPDKAVQRELDEEIEQGHLPLTLWRNFTHHQAVGPENSQLIEVDQYIYKGRIDLPTASIPLHEGQALGFFNLEDLDDLPIAFNFKQVFREFFLEGQHES